jgi:hypothetical protein
MNNAKTRIRKSLFRRNRPSYQARFRELDNRDENLPSDCQSLSRLAHERAALDMPNNRSSVCGPHMLNVRARMPGNKHFICQSSCTLSKVAPYGWIVGNALLGALRVNL